METRKKHLEREWSTISKMIGIYCAVHHDGGDAHLCDDCRSFQDYARRRLEKCPYGEEKPTCANCPVHCYKPARREQVKKIMRFAGPRMLLYHPLLTIAHKWDGLRHARHPRELTREERLRSRNG